MNMKTGKGLSKSKGFSLMEISLAMLIMAVLAFVVLSLYNSNKETQKVQAMINSANILNGAIASMFSTQGNFEGLDTSVILRSANFPISMRNAANIADRSSANSAIRHEWLDATAVGVAVSVGSTSTKDGYWFSFADIPREACATIVSSLYRGFVGIDATQGASTEGTSNPTDGDESDNISDAYAGAASLSNHCVNDYNVITFENRR